MEKVLKIGKYVITTPLERIVYDLKLQHPNGKLQDINVSRERINVTCVNDNHAGGREKHPDANINLENTTAPYGWYRCFACELSCSFVGFVANYFGSSYAFAESWLIERYGAEAEDVFLIGDEIDISKKRERYLNESILDNYQTWTPYLAQRKLSRDICEKFKVRYDPYLRQVIFPIYDERGNLKMLARRSIDTKFFHMDSDQEKEVYGLNLILKNNVKSCLLVEGPIDLLSCYTHGFPAIALLGTPSDYQINKINKSCLTSIYIATDNDSAGNRFAELLDEKLSDRIFKTRINIPKPAKDVNDLTEEQWKEIFSKNF